MIYINNIPYSIEDILFVFALESEAAKEFDHTKKLLTGIGKVNAAIEAYKRIAEKQT